MHYTPGAITSAALSYRADSDLGKRIFVWLRRERKPCGRLERKIGKWFIAVFARARFDAFFLARRTIPPMPTGEL